MGASGEADRDPGTQRPSFLPDPPYLCLAVLSRRRHKQKTFENASQKPGRKTDVVSGHPRGRGPGGAALTQSRSSVRDTGSRTRQPGRVPSSQPLPRSPFLGAASSCVREHAALPGGFGTDTRPPGSPSCEPRASSAAWLCFAEPPPGTGAQTASRALRWCARRALDRELSARPPPS